MKKFVVMVTLLSFGLLGVVELHSSTPTAASSLAIVQNVTSPTDDHLPAAN